jgi:predicted ATPase/DNA-binding SARP family transcriptional activator
MLNEVWRISLLGGIQAHRRHVSIERFRTRKTAVLLAYLAFHAGHVHSREMLATLLWPDAEPALGLKSLGVALSSLRKLLEPPDTPVGAVVTGDRLTAGLRAESVHTDVAVFTTAVDAWRSAHDQDARLANLQAAVRAYAGDFAAGHLDDWILVERERLQLVHRRALTALTGMLEQRGPAVDALPHALELAVADPYDAESCLRVMRLYAASDQSGDARRHFAAFADRLARDLDVQPPAALREFAQRLRPSTQASPHTASDTRSMPSRPQSPERDAPDDNLPTALTRLVGRQHDIDALQPLLGRRLLTLTGPGGVGKTRLAVEAARRSTLSGGHRALFVPLADLAASAEVPAAIADTLGMAVPPGPFDEGQLFRALGSTPTVLLLDNAEHLLEESGGGRLSSFVQELLARAPSVHVLVTSRQPIGLDGEQVFPVRPLVTPNAADTEHPSSNDLAGYACVELFIDRARLKQPDFQVTARNAAAVADLCSRLDGIPLAIELAAGLIRVLPPAQLAIRLRQTQQDLVDRRRPAATRHASLSAVMDWSFRLLPARLQESFCILSVLRGTWSVEAAQAICGGDAIEVIDLLCDRSLIQSEPAEEEPRYRMLETIRSYAATELEARGLAADARRRHAAYFTACAGSHPLRYRMPELGPGERHAVDALSDQYPNVSAALDWRLAATPADADVWPLAATLSRFWLLSRRLGEGHERLLAMLPIARRAADPASLCTLLNHAGTIAWFLGDYPRAQEMNREVLLEARRHHLLEHEATAIHGLGVDAGVRGDAGARDALFSEAVERFRSLGDVDHLGWSLMTHGWLVLSHGDDAGAALLLQQGAAVYAAAGDRLQLGWCQMYLAVIACRQGDTRAADRLSREGLATFHEHRSAGGQLWMLLHMATIALAAGDFRRAGVLAGHVDASLVRSGMQLPPAEHAERERVMSGVREALGDQAALDAHVSGTGFSAEQAFEYASGAPVGLV